MFSSDGKDVTSRRVFDAKESNDTSITRRTRCITSTHFRYHHSDALEKMSHLDPGQDVERLVLDFVTARGSRNGPLSREAVVSLALRRPRPWLEPASERTHANGHRDRQPSAEQHCGRQQLRPKKALKRGQLYRR